MTPGPRNLITDVPGLKVGNAQDDALKSGTTVLTADEAFTASVHVMGGAPGTRETDLLAPDKSVSRCGCHCALRWVGLWAGRLFRRVGCAAVQGRGIRSGIQVVPIVPGAILFDLLNGGDKEWTENPYRALGRARHLKTASKTLLWALLAQAPVPWRPCTRAGWDRPHLGSGQRGHRRRIGRGQPAGQRHHARRPPFLGRAVRDWR